MSVATGTSGAAAPSASGVATGSTAKPRSMPTTKRSTAGPRSSTEDLRTIVRENMEWVTDTFAAALAADLITADDFS